MIAQRAAYLEAAGSAVALLSDPAVAAAWDRPSALAQLAVSGLAGHLARQVLTAGWVPKASYRPAMIGESGFVARRGASGMPGRRRPARGSR